LGGKTPNEKCSELAEKTPFWDQVEAQYLSKPERIQEQNYQLELELRKLK
ncbi:MAG: IS481 family transposase, partial [Pseudomonadota bacterium]